MLSGISGSTLTHVLGRSGEGNDIGFNYYFVRYVFILEHILILFAMRLLTDVITG